LLIVGRGRRKTMNSLKQLGDFGQSIWLDYIRRDLITSGEFRRLVEDDGVRGVTSNPTIFDKAIAAGTDYDDALRSLLAADPDSDALTLFEKLEIEDLQMAATSCGQFMIRLKARMASSASRCPRD
jgi:transaldolase